jgi:hypothetical protein
MGAFIFHRLSRSFLFQYASCGIAKHQVLPEIIRSSNMADEKKISEFSESQLSRSDDEAQEITWTEAEEEALIRRYALPNLQPSRPEL